MSQKTLYVRDWMTQQPVTVVPDACLADAYELMVTNGVRRLPVVDRQGQLVGIITRSDIHQLLPVTKNQKARLAAEMALRQRLVREIMSWEPVTIEPDQTIQAAAELMLEYTVSGLPVVDADRLVGIITESDIFRLVVELWDDPNA